MQGIGTDIIEIDRIRQAIDRLGQNFVDRLFTKGEQEYCRKYQDPAPHYAARFAAKEAIVKALGTGLRGGLSWTDIEIIRDESGRPTGRVNGRELLISMSHCKEHATAVALLP